MQGGGQGDGDGRRAGAGEARRQVGELGGVDIAGARVAPQTQKGAISALLFAISAENSAFEFYLETQVLPIPAGKPTLQLPGKSFFS